MTTETETTRQLAPVLAALADVVAGIGADQVPGPTPCTDYDVAALRRHAMDWISLFAAGFADPDGQAPRADLDGYQPPANAGAAIRESAVQLESAIAGGAATRPLRLGDSAMPAGMALSMILWEYLVHGLDLAVATGQGWRPPEPAVEAALQFAPGMLTEDYQGEGKAFGPRVAVAADAPALDRLLGLSGCDPT